MNVAATTRLSPGLATPMAREAFLTPVSHPVTSPRTPLAPLKLFGGLFGGDAGEPVPEDPDFAKYVSMEVPPSRLYPALPCPIPILWDPLGALCFFFFFALGP